MSYCRKSDDSDVYMCPDIEGYICCCACNIYGTAKFTIPQLALGHLEQHLAKGDRVPSCAIKRLQKEANLNSNDSIRADILMNMLKEKETWIENITQSFYRLLKVSYGQQYADEWINDKDKINDFLFDIDKEFAQE